MSNLKITDELIMAGGVLTNFICEQGDGYKKYEDGTLEQWGKSSIEPDSDISYVGQAFTFSQPFVDTPEGILLSYNTVASSPPNVTIEAYNIKNTGFSFRLGLDGQFLPMSNVFYIAKGKWK